MHPLGGHYAELERRLVSLCYSLNNRVADSQLRDVRDYVEHNEFGLATEVLVEYLCDGHIGIIPSEYEVIMSVYEAMKTKLDVHLLKELQNLIRKA